MSAAAGSRGGLLAGALMLALVAMAASLACDSSGGSSSVPTYSVSLLALSLAEAGEGLRVESVVPGGPADEAGLQPGDLLTALDGRSLTTIGQLQAALDTLDADSGPEISFERAGQRLQVRLPLQGPAQAGAGQTPAPSQPTAAPQSPDAGQKGGRLGVGVQQITPQVKQRMALTVDSGVVVVQVMPDSAASKAGLQPGDVLLSLNATPTASVEELQRAVLTAPVGQTIVISVRRGAENLSLQAALPAQANLEGLDAILPPALKERLQQQIDAGTLPPDQLQAILRLYAARGDNVRVGTVTRVDAKELVLQSAATDHEVTVMLTSQTAVRRGGTVIAPGALQAGETVLVLSIDGGRSAFQVHAFGVLR